MKICRNCGSEKDNANFHKDKTKKDGYGGCCKACSKELSRAYYLKNEERIRFAVAARKRGMSAEKMLDKKAKDAAYRAKNRERSAAYLKVWTANNRQRRLEICAKYRERNRLKVNAAVRKWAAKNPEKRRTSSQNRRAIKIGSGGRVSPGLSKRLFVLQRGRCACCGLPLGDAYHMDHIMPLALGGANEDSNIQLLRATCNHQKNKKHPVDFMRTKGYLL